MIEVFFATMNKDKIMKMKNRLKDLDINLVTPYDISISIEIEENGENVIENATLKAKAYFDKIKIPTIATDSALYVEKFEVQPGLFVKRINGVTLDDEKLEEHYINELNKVGGKSNAFYVTGIVIVQCGKVDSIEIKEDNFTFTSKIYEGKRGLDPLGRLEYDDKIKKYFCQLNENEMDKRGYCFDIEAKKFIISKLINSNCAPRKGQVI